MKKLFIAFIFLLTTSLNAFIYYPHERVLDHGFCCIEELEGAELAALKAVADDAYKWVQETRLQVLNKEIRLTKKDCAYLFCIINKVAQIYNYCDHGNI